MITVIDKSGQQVNRRAEPVRHWIGVGAIGGTRSGSPPRARGQQSIGPQLHAVSLAGVERTVYSAPDWLVLHDISTDGRVLLSRNSIRVNAACQAPGEASERDLGWLLQSIGQRIVSRRPDADLL